MKHIKLKARRKSEDDGEYFISYDYDLELEVDGKTVDPENFRVLEVSFDVERAAPIVRLELIPDTLEVDADVPPELGFEDSERP